MTVSLALTWGSGSQAGCPSSCPVTSVHRWVSLMPFEELPRRCSYERNIFSLPAVKSSLVSYQLIWGDLCFVWGASGKEPACQCRRGKRWGSVPRLGRCPGGGNGNPLQYSCLKNPIDRGASWAMVHKGCKELDVTEAT